MPVTCALCEGTDFYKEAGFYFCTECQTQTQDIQEHVFEDQADDVEQPLDRVPKKKTRRTSSNNKPKDEERLTSWECYNYILLGLVNELIELGADKSLQTVVEVLWFQYLKKIEVIRDGNLPPKLPAVNNDRDAAIIYGRTKPVKRRRSRSKSAGSSNHDASLDGESIRRERTKRKKALAKSEYNEYLSTTQQSETSLANQSLSSLKSQSSSITDTKIVEYNKAAEKCLKKHMKRSHLKRHCEDVHSVLSCHKKLTGRTARGYYADPSLLSRSKLFSLLYLGLLINKESIQLGDMLRFIREGHLSFHNVDKFFPEELTEKNLNDCSFTKGPRFLTHPVVRSQAAKMMHYLNFKSYVPVQNIIEMCERYCKELNLPDSIYEYVLNIISRTVPKFPLSSKTSLPNYEGRAIGFIIFVLKLLFGLDDATEYEMSRLASTINSHLTDDEQKMFDFEKWLIYIKYRHFILCHHYFPAAYSENWHDETKIFVKHLEQYAEKHELVTNDECDIEIFKRLLSKLEHVWEDSDNGIVYKPSLTPYKDYINTILTNNEDGLNFNKDTLRLDCSNMSLEYIFYGELYLKQIYSNVNIIRKSGGKNDDIQFMYLFDADKRARAKCRERREFYNITLKSKEHMTKSKKLYNIPKDEEIKPNSKQLVEDFERRTAKKLKRNFKRRQKLFQNVDKPLIKSQKVDDTPTEFVLYDPSERFCANVQNVSLYTEEEWNKFYNKFSLAFRSILAECARITEQTPKELYLEYTKIEIYLGFILDIGKDKPYEERFVNSELRKSIQSTKKSW